MSDPLGGENRNQGSFTCRADKISAQQAIIIGDRATFIGRHALHVFRLVNIADIICTWPIPLWHHRQVNVVEVAVQTTLRSSSLVDRIADKELRPRIDDLISSFREACLPSNRTVLLAICFIPTNRDPILNLRHFLVCTRKTI